MRSRSSTAAGTAGPTWSGTSRSSPRPCSPPVQAVHRPGCLPPGQDGKLSLDNDGDKHSRELPDYVHVVSRPGSTGGHSERSAQLTEGGSLRTTHACPASPGRVHSDHIPASW